MSFIGRGHIGSGWIGRSLGGGGGARIPVMMPTFLDIAIMTGEMEIDTGESAIALTTGDGDLVPSVVDTDLAVDSGDAMMDLANNEEDLEFVDG